MDLQVLAHVCQEEAAAWPTTLHEDRALLQQGKALSARAHMALRFRIEKKTVLGECLKAYMRQAG